ncbi:MAG TPA: uroporphyrinogen-III C-methyltransferase [Thermoanaerobaculia bacterium]
MSRIRIGTRGSPLALWQANEVARKLSDAGFSVDVVSMKTSGDKRQDVPLAAVGGKGLFIKELEEALDRGEIDLAVHSLKDVPSIIPPQFTLAGFLERGDPRDVWVHPDGVSITDLPAGSTIGTSSPRRRAQLMEKFPHLEIESIRGNVETRINKTRNGQYAGIVLAAAGLTRLGRQSDITSWFSVDEMIPAAGQGIIAIETLVKNNSAREAAASITDKSSELAAQCERGVLQRFGERLDCYSVIAVHATTDDGELTIRAYDGVKRVRRSGRDPQEVIGSIYDDLRASEPTSGRVYLVGAGPGDPRLLTLRAAELLESADVVVLDALVSKEIVARISKAAQIIYAGKRAAAHTLPQEKINQVLIDEAKKGRKVVRLKGGDPFVFGRGGEEAEELIAAGVSIEIVPGISSAVAGPAYAGIPVTHRSYATSVTLVTGHEAEEGSTGIRWPALAQLDGTIVFMMGLANLPAISQKLIEHGAPADRPVAVISNGTRPDQRTVVGTLRNIEQRVAEAKMPTPALIVVGEVVKLREVIDWFETKPLFGKRVVVTRARDQASQLVQLLADSGANVLQFPTIRTVPPASFDSLDGVIDGEYDVVAFTSVNGVRAYFDRLLSRGRDARTLAGSRIAAVGDTTAAELRERGIVADIVPEKFQSTALLPFLDPKQRIAVVRAAEGSDELVETLRSRGGEVDIGVAYRTIAVDEDLAELRELIASDAIDVVTFTSGSTVSNFFDMLAPEERSRLLHSALIASIGPVTSETIRRYGRGPDVEAKTASIQALHDAVVEAASRLHSPRERRRA